MTQSIPELLASNHTIEELQNQAFAAQNARDHHLHRFCHDAIQIKQQERVAEQGQLRSTVEIDAAGRKITKYHGDPLVWMAPFMGVGVVCAVDRDTYLAGAREVK